MYASGEGENTAAGGPPGTTIDPCCSGRTIGYRFSRLSTNRLGAMVGAIEASIRPGLAMRTQTPIRLWLKLMPSI